MQHSPALPVQLGQQKICTMAETSLPHQGVLLYFQARLQRNQGEIISSQYTKLEKQQQKSRGPKALTKTLTNIQKKERNICSSPFLPEQMKHSIKGFHRLLQKWINLYGLRIIRLSKDKAN